MGGNRNGPYTYLYLSEITIGTIGRRRRLSVLDFFDAGELWAARGHEANPPSAPVSGPPAVNYSTRQGRPREELKNLLFSQV